LNFSGCVQDTHLYLYFLRLGIVPGLFEMEQHWQNECHKSGPDAIYRNEHGDHIFHLLQRFFSSNGTDQLVCDQYQINEYKDVPTQNSDPVGRDAEC
jgi:hypothetical protein